MEQRQNRRSQIANRQLFAWQGWWIELPAGWNPVRIEGHYESGSALIADLRRPRLALRWAPAGKVKDQAQWLQRAMRQEVGQLAAEEARPLGEPRIPTGQGLLYVEPEPPGRDVWIGISPGSRRCIEVVHHAQRRQKVLAGMLLPALRDCPLDRPLPWSVFDLSCRSPQGMSLSEQHLNAGDLSLKFTGGADEAAVRQIAVAELALRRMSLERWLAAQEAARGKHYRVHGQCEAIELVAEDGRRMEGVLRAQARRRRWFLRRGLPRRLVGAALHDQDRDRLVIVQATSERLLRELAATVGWAGPAQS